MSYAVGTYKVVLSSSAWTQRVRGTVYCYQYVCPRECAMSPQVLYQTTILGPHSGIIYSLDLKDCQILVIPLSLFLTRPDLGHLSVFLFTESSF